MLKQLLFFNKFYNFFCRQYFSMNRPSYNLFQIKQHDNFQNLNSVIITQWKHLQPRVNTF